MNRTVLYHLSMGIAGLAIAFVGITTLDSAGLSVSSTLLTVAGLAMAAHASYTLHRGEFGRDVGRMAWVAAAAAILSVLGAVLVVLP